MQVGRILVVLGLILGGLLGGDPPTSSASDENQSVNNCSSLAMPIEDKAWCFTQRDMQSYARSEFAGDPMLFASLATFSGSPTAPVFTNVKDFGAKGDGLTDDTAAFIAAQAASDLIVIPSGTYLLDNFQQQNRKVFVGAGLNSTFIRQKSMGNPAWWCVSKAGVYETQILGAGLSGVWFLGKSEATVASLIVEGATPYVVAYSHFDIGGSGGFHTLEIKTTGSFEVYSSTFKVVQDDPDNRSGGLGSTNTGVVLGSGVYNEFWLNITKAQNGIAVVDSGWNSVFRHCVSDGQQIFGGQNNVIHNPTVESWTGSARNSAIANIGGSNVLLNPVINNVPQGKIATAGLELNGGGGNKSTIVGLRILGMSSSITFTGALVGATSATLTTPFTSDATGIYQVAFSDGSTQACSFTNGGTQVTWTRPVTATASATMVYNVVSGECSRLQRPDARRVSPFW